MYNIMVDLNVQFFIYFVVVITAVNCYSSDTQEKRTSNQRKDFDIPLNADIGTLQSCDDVEYEFSHVCPHIYWSPGSHIDPLNEIRVWANFSMPFDLDIGSTLITVKVQGQPVFEDRLDFTCDILKAANAYLAIPTECPVSVSTNIAFTYTFTDVLGLKAYPGEYESEFRLKNIDGYGVCCTANVVIMA